MSVREYIGARYVPLFAEPTTWDATRTYEPLTVVLYQGNSYTSRQAVPANIDITNTTYWAQTGNYNAQIEQYRAEVATYNGRITTLENKFPLASSDIGADAITSEKIADNAVGTSNIVNNAVTADKIANNAVGTSNIINNAVTTDKIANNAVTENKIADGSVSANKLSLDLKTKESLFLMPEQYGAVGDGTTDDTQAFKDMLDDIVYDTVIVLHPFKRYVISETLNIDKGQIGIISLADLEYKPAIVFTSNVTVGFYVTGFSFYTENINIVGQDTNHEITLIKFDFDSTTLDGNIDATISNTAFIYAKRGIELLGRNLHVHHSIFSQIGQRGITILQTQNITTAMRGYDFEHNRFHDCVTAIQNDIMDYVVEGCSAKISDNYMDGGYVFYNGTSDNVFIVGNYISRIVAQYTNIISFTRTCKDESMCVVENNFANCTQSYSGEYPRSFINVSASCFGTFVVNGNSFNTKCALPGVNVGLFIENSTKKTIVVCKNNTMINRVTASGIYFTGATNIYGVASGNVVNGTVSGSPNSHVSMSDNTNISSGI